MKYSVIDRLRHYQKDVYFQKDHLNRSQFDQRETKGNYYLPGFLAQVYVILLDTVFLLINAGPQISAETPPSNNRLPFNKCRTSKCRVYYNSHYILLAAKQRCIWNWYAKNKTMKILLIFRFFHYIWYIDSENLCFIIVHREYLWLHNTLSAMALIHEKRPWTNY